ncbi:MAG: DUF2294 family protein [Solirubrobacteraceae bacterium]|nr:DUF2294 family protein [Solirubrobacteraceae bacterium]
MTEPSAPVADTDPLGAIARRIVQLQKQHLGRGPKQVRVHRLDELVVVLLRDVYTPLEQTLVTAGRVETVFENRRHIHKVMNELYRPVVEEEIGRRVDAVMSMNHVAPDIAVKLFVLAPPAAR